MPLRSMAWVMAPISRNFQLSPFWAARYSREESLAPGFSYRGNTESPWAAQISSLRARRGLQSLGGLPQFPTRLPADGVHHKVGNAGARRPGEWPPTPRSPGQAFWANSKAMAWAFSNVTASFGGEGLHVLVEVHALRLAIGALGGQKFLKGIVPQAVDAGDKPLAR